MKRTSTGLRKSASSIIDQCVAQGVPFAREYGGLLDNRSFGGAQVSRTFYARGQTGQQLLLGAYQRIDAGRWCGQSEDVPRTEMLDLVVVDGKARGIVTRNLVTGEIRTHAADAVVLAPAATAMSFFLSTNAKSSNATAIWRAHKRGAFFANPCYTQIHPTCIPVSGEHQSKLTLMSESPPQRRARLGAEERRRQPAARTRFPKPTAIITSSGSIRRFGNLVASRCCLACREGVCDEGRGVGPAGSASISISATR